MGLKPDPPGRSVGAVSWPQSNQRGIETRLERLGRARSDSRLNRTSVGLKLAGLRDRSGGVPRLNRTSVGLKHLSDPRQHPRGGGLNQTSVGLKRGSC